MQLHYKGYQHHIVGDDAFPVNARLMKPYPYRNLEKGKRIFNYRLSQAHRVFENAFGILAHRWRVFLRTIKLSPEKVTDIIFAACCLLNAMTEQEQKKLHISCRPGECRSYIGKTFLEKSWKAFNRSPSTMQQEMQNPKENFWQII